LAGARSGDGGRSSDRIGGRSPSSNGPPAGPPCPCRSRLLPAIFLRRLAALAIDGNRDPRYPVWLPASAKIPPDHAGIREVCRGERIAVSGFRHKDCADEVGVKRRARMARGPARHAGGQRFESSIAHSPCDARGSVHADTSTSTCRRSAVEPDPCARRDETTRLRRPGDPRRPRLVNLGPKCACHEATGRACVRYQRRERDLPGAYSSPERPEAFIRALADRGPNGRRPARHWGKSGEARRTRAGQERPAPPRGPGRFFMRRTA
jgi:hypothetical protein